MLLFAEYLPDKDNVAADALSRDNILFFINRFMSGVFSSSRTDPGTGHTLPRLDVRQLEELVQFNFTKGPASYTQRTLE